MKKCDNNIFPFKKRSGVLVVTDADNTLWDTDSIYAEGQLELLKRIELETGLRANTRNRLGFVRALDQELARLNQYNLTYPPEFLAYAIAIYLEGVSLKKATMSAITNVELLKSNAGITKHGKWFKNHLINNIPKLRPGVKTGLWKLNEIGLPLLVLTEGSREKCQTLLHHYDLMNCIFEIIEGRKLVSLYKNIARNFVNVSKRKVMIGDQLDRDIIAAKRAGYTTVYFPSRFQPSWMPRDKERNISDYRISSLMKFHLYCFN
jgi:putative hydrolase of the HAD superfamily